MEPTCSRPFADAETARWNRGPAGPEAADQFMGRRNDRSGADHASWAVADVLDRLVGSVSVHTIDPDQADAEIGYWVAPWARCEGYAARAVGAASLSRSPSWVCTASTPTTQSTTRARDALSGSSTWRTSFLHRGPPVAAERADSQLLPS